MPKKSQRLSKSYFLCWTMDLTWDKQWYFPGCFFQKQLLRKRKKNPNLRFPSGSDDVWFVGCCGGIFFFRKTSLVQCQLGTTSSEDVLISEASRPQKTRVTYIFQCFKSLGFQTSRCQPHHVFWFGTHWNPCRANSKGADGWGDGLVRESAPPKWGPETFCWSVPGWTFLKKVARMNIDASQWLELKHGFQPFLDIFVSKNTCC